MLEWSGCRRTNCFKGVHCSFDGNHDLGLPPILAIGAATSYRVLIKDWLSAREPLLSRGYLAVHGKSCAQSAPASSFFALSSTRSTAHAMHGVLKQAIEHTQTLPLQGYKDNHDFFQTYRSSAAFKLDISLCYQP
jgi:hypothetical protein